MKIPLKKGCLRVQEPRSSVLHLEYNYYVILPQTHKVEEGRFSHFLISAKKRISSMSTYTGSGKCG